MRLRIPLVGVVSCLGCAPQFPEPERGDVVYEVEHTLSSGPNVRLGAFPWQLGEEIVFGDEFFSAPLDASPFRFEVPSFDGPWDSVGDLDPVTGPAVMLFVAAYEDLDDSGRFDVGEPLRAASPNSLLQVEAGSWFTFELPDGIVDPSSMTLGTPSNGTTLEPIAAPVGFPFGGTLHASMPPSKALPTPPANRVSTIALAENEIGEALPGRPVDAPIQKGAWALDLPAEPAPPFVAARAHPNGAFGAVAIEAVVAYIDDGDGMFTPDFTGGLPSFDPMGMPSSDFVVGQACYRGHAVFAVYRPVPTNFDDLLVTWALGGMTGWSLVTGLDADEPVPVPVPVEDFGALELVSGDCALQSKEER